MDDLTAFCTNTAAMSTPATQPVKTKSKAYSSTVAIQGDAAKYRQKYKELKRKTREIEVENDKLHLKTLRIKRNIQRMRLERAILYERLESETQDTTGPYAPQAYDAGSNVRSNDPYAMADPSAVASRADYTSYHPSAASRQRVVDPRGAPEARSGSAAVSSVGSAQSVTAPSYDRKERLSYGYDVDYPPPPPPQSHPHAYSHPYDARPRSPPTQALPPAAPPSTGDRAERLRQYTPSASPEPHAADDADPNSRSGMKITLRRGV